MAEEREVILKLGKKITDRIPQHLGLKKMSKEDPEYWGLAEILTDEMAELALTMKVRVHYTLDQIAQMNPKHTKEECEKLCEEMSRIGLLEYSWENRDGKNPKGEKRYLLAMFVPGSAEMFMMNPEVIDKHPIIADFFERMAFLPLEKVTPMVPLGGAGVGMHVIPVEKAIPAEQQSVSVEHLSHWLKKYDRYGVGICSCRKQQRMRGEGTGDTEGEYCIAVGDFARYAGETGKGRDITYEEAMEIIERSERHGYVHQITNIDGEDKIFGICNCAPGVCNGLRTSQLFNTPNMSRSAYRAHVEKEKCVACGKCVEVCPVGAAKLGQKLCKKDGSDIAYPKALLPDETAWGKDKWDFHYRDTAKINCYETGTAPCKTACPAHLAVQGYIKMAAEGRYEDALKLIKQDNPFPAVCGAICNRRCEDACTRGTIDEPLAIDEIKKFIAQQELEADKRYIPVCENGVGQFYEEKVAIIGGGPSGMSAAFYLREKGYPVTIFEKEKRAGGMLLNGIPSFRLEKDVVQAEIDVLEAMGIEFKFNTEIGKDITIQQLREEGYKAFYVAIGAQGGRKANVPGEDAEGVLTGVEFLKTVNMDAEGTKLSGKTIVVGGGNVAIDVARAALRAGSSEVSMFCLEQRDEMPAAADEVAEAEEEGILINNGWGPKEVVSENGRVTGIIFKKCTAVFDENHRFNPVYDENDCKTYECENVLLSIGQAIIWDNLLEGSKVELGRGGAAEADAVTLQTAEPDIFVGGDVYTGPKFAIDAIAAGKQACESIHRFVHEGHSLTLGRDLRQFVELDKEDINVETFDNAKRQIPGKKTGIAKSTFSDLRSVFTEEQVKAEADRCLGCGATVVDENKCIGCGLCTTRCEFDAIHLSRDLPDASNMYRAEDKLKAIAPYAAKRAIKIKKNKKKD
ncbi:MAG: FAD-dependent oxidoreductase [Hespellia sp.]|nr:FAD-dependent oxidoreductase [Hespellia sp.]